MKNLALLQKNSAGNNKLQGMHQFGGLISVTSCLPNLAQIMQCIYLKMSGMYNDYWNSVAFSPDTRQFVSGSNEMTIQIWDVEMATVICEPHKGHNSQVSSIEFSPDSR